MMNLNCVICADLLGPTDEVHVTPCGHLFHQTCLLQWLERSKTCPQCRNKCIQKSCHKIYFNLANLDTSSIDIGSLQQQLEEVKLQNQVKCKDEEKLKKQIEELKGTRKKCMETITALESKVESKAFAITQYSEQIKILKAETKVLDAQRKEITELKKQIELIETVQTIISATTSEVENLIAQDSRPQSLATWVVILKKELRASEMKKTDIRNTLKTVQQDLRKVQELKRNLELKVSNLESENYQLTSKVEILEKDGPTQACNCQKKSNVVEVLDTLSPGVPQRIKQIEDSDSPYFNIKSSSLGLHSITKVSDRVRSNQSSKESIKRLKRPNKPDSIFETNNNFAALKKSRSEDLSDKYSIFKKPRILLEPTTNKFNPSLAFNGLGGSEKIFTSPKKSLLLEDELRSKANNINSRLKAGKLRKTASSTQLGCENTIDKFIKKS